MEEEALVSRADEDVSLRRHHVEVEVEVEVEVCGVGTGIWTPVSVALHRIKSRTREERTNIAA